MARFLLGGNSLYGQDTIPADPQPYECHCYDVQYYPPTLRITRIAASMNTYYHNGCFILSISDFNPTNCSNFFSIELDFSDFPSCFLTNYTISEKDINNNWLPPLATDFPLPSSTAISLSLDGLNNKYKYQYNRQIRFCPSNNIDCGYSKLFKIKYKLKLKHPNGSGGNSFEDCENQNSTEVGYLDQASDVAEDPNYIFTFTPLPVKNVLNVSCSTLNNFNALIYDSKSNLISSYKNLNNNSSIDLSSLIKGVYFIQILENEKPVLVKKFTKE